MEHKTRMPYEAVYAAVTARIVQGHYRPTHRIGIAALAESLSVSTTPVREALRQLAGRDIIVERHREGFYLAPLTARAIAGLYGAHGHWMQQILATRPSLRLGERHRRGLWRAFDLVADRSGDAAMSAVRRYLDDRLLVLRRHEALAIRDLAATGSLFAQAVATGEHDRARVISDAFHVQCAQEAQRLAEALYPIR